jgi:hypothetical protein
METEELTEWAQRHVEALNELGLLTESTKAINMLLVALKKEQVEGTKLAAANDLLRQVAEHVVERQAPILHDLMYWCQCCSCDPTYEQPDDLDHDEDCVYEEARTLLRGLKEEKDAGVQ